MHDFDSGDYPERFSDYYRYVKTLGRGAFGTVVQCIDKYSQEEVAVKVITKKKVKPEYITRLRTEADILESLYHPNIIQFKHLKETRTRIFLVTEVVHGKNLKHFLREKVLTETQAHLIIKGILEAVGYIHSRNVIHRDIKPENILIAHSPFQVKLADFGLSAQHEFRNKEPLETDRCGTLLFMAPEQRFNSHYGKEVDVWSCGLILYMLFSKGKHPIAKKRETFQSYSSRLKTFKWSFPPEFPDPVRELILKMTDPLPLTRYSATQALAHPWIQKVCKKPPVTPFEELKIYADEMKIKTVLFSLIFASLLHKEEPKPPRLVPKPLARARPKRSSNFMTQTKSWEAKTVQVRRVLPQARSRALPFLPKQREHEHRRVFTAVNSRRDPLHKL